MVDSGHTLRILHVTQPVSGGVARCVESLVDDQLARGWDVSVACPERGRLPDRLRAAGRRIHPWQSIRSPTSLAVVRELRQLGLLLSDVRPDIIHLHSSKAGMIGRLLVRRRIPTICQPHSWSFHATKGNMRAWVIAWERFSARWADVLLCVSEAEREEGLRVGLRSADMTVVRNGVDPARWPLAGAAERAAARARLGLDPFVPLAVTVGRLCEQKGQDLLLRAWPQVSSRVRGARLVLVGDGAWRRELEAGAAWQTGVYFVGQSDRVATWLAAANVVVSPSRWDGLALALLEAASTGRSVVATDVGGAREVIGSGADTGGVVVGGSGTAVLSGLATAIVTRLADGELADAEGRVARRRVEEGFTLRSTLDATADLTLRLVGSRRGVTGRAAGGCRGRPGGPARASIHTRWTT